MNQKRQEFIKHCIRYRVPLSTIGKYLGITKGRVWKLAHKLKDEKVYCDICRKEGVRVCENCKLVYPQAKLYKGKQ